MSKKILLINPWIHDFAAYDFWIKPLGLLYLGDLLRQNGHKINFIDCLDPYHPTMPGDSHKRPQRHSSGRGKFFRQIIPKPDSLKMISKNYCRYGVTPEIFREELKSHLDTDIILITSMMTYWYPGVFEAIKIIKEVLPLVPIVLGGKYATLCYDHAVKYSGADFVIAGSGEKQVLQLLKDLFGEEPSFMPDGDNLDSLPYPAFDLIRKIDQLPITTSRGCPYHCSYCASHIFNDKFRRRDPVKIADEIEYWQKKYGVINFSFYEFALAEFMMGVGSGMFGTPNTASIMNSVPAEDRGVASGMISTMRNTAGIASMAIFFTIVIVGITQRFPEAMASSLASIGAVHLTPILSKIPPTAALFSAFLGYNPVESILTTLPPSLTAIIPASTLNTLTGITWFPSTLATAFLPSLGTSFYIGAIISAIAAILSALRGEKYIHKDKELKTRSKDDLKLQEADTESKSK